MPADLPGAAMTDARTLRNDPNDSLPEAGGQRERARLLARMRRRYPLKCRVVNVSGMALEITGVEDPDQVLLEMEQGILAAGREEPRWQPYWAESWESAVALGNCVAEWQLASKSVLDLGCGLGLAGIVAAARGADVLLADAAPPALLFARYNAWPWRDQVRTARIDWREDRIQRQFDLILGADVLYDLQDWPYLHAFWRQHLRPGGAVLIGEPGRRSADDWPAWAQTQGWQVVGTWTFAVGSRNVRCFQLC
jgi:2-polyprenyl-3-methyl-5-hydroxy-6-metoxy-1,4-benzoquinol methylase